MIESSTPFCQNTTSFFHLWYGLFCLFGFSFYSWIDNTIILIHVQLYSQEEEEKIKTGESKRQRKKYPMLKSFLFIYIFYCFSSMDCLPLNSFINILSNRLVTLHFSIYWHVPSIQIFLLLLLLVVFVHRPFFLKWEF